jgi:23S rRNA pseudouridine1911/1915/1917 synthase
LVNALIAHCGNGLTGIGGELRPGIVHRLDKDTSGLMVAAKTQEAHDSLSAQFAARTVGRVYCAVVWGVPVPAQGDITGNIGRSPRNRKKMAILKRGGKKALTHYEMSKELGPGHSGLASVVDCRLATGRTHQVRVHMAAISHPLIGDPLYGRGSRGAGRGAGSSVSHSPLLARQFPRQALHARALAFRHPRTGHSIEFASHLPMDMRDLIGCFDLF